MIKSQVMCTFICFNHCKEFMRIHLDSMSTKLYRKRTRSSLAQRLIALDSFSKKKRIEISSDRKQINRKV